MFVHFLTSRCTLSWFFFFFLSLFEISCTSFLYILQVFLKVICNSCPYLNSRLSIASPWLDHPLVLTQPLLHQQLSSSDQLTVVGTLLVSLIELHHFTLNGSFLWLDRIISVFSDRQRRSSIHLSLSHGRIILAGFSLCFRNVTHPVPESGPCFEMCQRLVSSVTLLYVTGVSNAV